MGQTKTRQPSYRLSYRERMFNTCVAFLVHLHVRPQNIWGKIEPKLRVSFPHRVRSHRLKALVTQVPHSAVS